MYSEYAYYRLPVIDAKSKLQIFGLADALLTVAFGFTLVIVPLAPFLPEPFPYYGYLLSILHVLPTWGLRILNGSLDSPPVNYIASWLEVLYFGLDTWALAAAIFPLIFEIQINTPAFITQIILLIFLFFYWIISIISLYYTSQLNRQLRARPIASDAMVEAYEQLAARRKRAPRANRNGRRKVD